MSSEQMHTCTRSRRVLPTQRKLPDTVSDGVRELPWCMDGRGQEMLPISLSGILDAFTKHAFIHIHLVLLNSRDSRAWRRNASQENPRGKEIIA